VGCAGAPGEDDVQVGFAWFVRVGLRAFAEGLVITDFDQLAHDVEASQLVVSSSVPPYAPPRWASARSDLPTHGHLDLQVARLLGWEPFFWQSEASDLAGEFDPVTGRPRFRTVGASVARQNGKTSWILTRVARQLLPAGQHVAYTAQDRSLARLKWEEHVDILMDTPFASRVKEVNKQRNQEKLVMKNGSWYMPVTPTAKKAARSLSLDLAIADEAYAHVSMGLAGAIRNTLLTRPLAQFYLVSNAGDETSVLWRHYTDLGRASIGDPDATICWIEYASSDDASRFDPVEVRAANPSAGEPGGVDWLSLMTEVRESDEATVRKENLNLWTSSGGPGLSRWWGQAKRSGFTVAKVLADGGRVVFGLDFEPDRDGGALMACAAMPDGQVFPIEVVAVADDPVSMDGLVKRAADNAIAHQSWVAVGASSPAASAIPALEALTARKVKVKRGGQYKTEDAHLVFPVTAQGTSRAVGAFHDAVVSAKVAHVDDPVLNTAVSAVVRREVGDTFVWQRRDVTGQSRPSLVTAATMAYWCALTSDPVPAAVTKSPRARAARRPVSGQPVRR